MSAQPEKKDAQARAHALQEFYNAPEDALFNQMTVSLIRDCSKFTMERDRWAGGGIPFIKIGRAVRYRKSDVIEWLAKPTQTSTSVTERGRPREIALATLDKHIGLYDGSPFNRGELCNDSK